MSDLDERYRTSLQELEPRGQQHLLHWWDSLDVDSREQLIGEIESIPWALVDELVESHIQNEPVDSIPADLAPAPVYRRTPTDDQGELYERAVLLGQELISAGKVAAFTVAGGQGSRLGVDGPKGAVKVTPVREKPLFQLFAEMICAARDRYGASIPWYIMTSPANHQQTVGFLSDHNFFGLPPQDVILFSQGMLPSFDFSGRILMSDKHQLALAPDGHGGSLKSLAASGALSDAKDRGIEIVSYFQVDNPLVQPFDELFLGLHRLTESEMSTKVTSKVDDLERVGNLCLADGRVSVIEYSNFPEELAHEKNADGTRKFDLGNLAIHLLDAGFIDRIVGTRFELPFHRAEKKVAWMDESGSLQTPPAEAPNSIKLEAFVFDALPLAASPLLLQIDRKEEFSPVKNAKGVDSAESAVRDQIHRAARWLESAGLEIPKDSNGEPAVVIEIAPSYAMTAEDVRRKATRPPSLIPGESIYLS
jgi:UDP-N-acetylglucosamine/UDP-N-acetylgalactosamine diphosphorylase